MKKQFIIFFFILFYLSGLGGSYAQQDSQVSANLDKRSAAVNEEINLTIKIAGSQGNIQAPRLPNIQGFDTFLYRPFVPFYVCQRSVFVDSGIQLRACPAQRRHLCDSCH